jgi:hypothetical protein
MYQAIISGVIEKISTAQESITYQFKSANQFESVQLPLENKISIAQNTSHILSSEFSLSIQYRANET